MDDRATPEEIDRLRAIVDAVSAPPSLRASIAAERDRVATPRARVRARLRPVAGLSAAAAALGVALALVLPAGGGAPTVLDAARLGAKPALAAAPPVDPERREVLAAAVGGVRFPAWGPERHWVAAGQRSDDLGGRATRTVFYDDDRGVRLGYTIVDGAPLAWPAGARRVVRDGVEVRLARSPAGRRVVVWRVGGRSCVISAPASVPEERLAALAASSTYG